MDAPAAIKYRSVNSREWYARVKDKAGNVTKLFLTGPQKTEDERAALIASGFPHVEYVDSWPADKPPGILSPVPKSFYMHGIIDAVNDELFGGGDVPRISRAPASRVLVPRKLIER